VNYSADLETRVQPCEQPVALGLRASHLIEASLGIGRVERVARSG
jgi:hypothetical protein